MRYPNNPENHGGSQEGCNSTPGTPGTNRLGKLTGEVRGIIDDAMDADHLIIEKGQEPLAGADNIE